MRDQAARWHQLRPCPPGCHHVVPSAFHRFRDIFLFLRMLLIRHFGVCQVIGTWWMETKPSPCGLWCHSSNVLSLCLCHFLNINRAEKCPEWNEFVAVWSWSIVTMVISRGVEGSALPCRTAEEQMTVFAAVLFRAQSQCVCMCAGVCVCVVYLPHCYWRIVKIAY